MAKKKKTEEKKARVHKDLEGFEIKINPLGEITSNFNIDQINEFLGKNVYDKKLVNSGTADDDDEYKIEESEETDENDDDFLKKPGSDDDGNEELPIKPKKKK